MAMCNRQLVFDKLRPLCVQLSKDHSRKNVVAVTKALEGIDRGCIQDLQEYLLFPLRIILKQPTKQYVVTFAQFSNSILEEPKKSSKTDYFLYRFMLNVCILFLFSSEDFYTDLFTLMEKILGCSRVWNWELFTDLFTSSCVMISSPSEHGSPEGKGHLSLYSFFLPCSRVFEIKNKSQVQWTGDFIKLTGLNKYSQVYDLLSHRVNRTMKQKLNKK